MTADTTMNSVNMNSVNRDVVIQSGTNSSQMLLTVENVLSIAEALLRAPEETVLSKKTTGGIEDGVLAEIESKRLIFDTLTSEDLADFHARANTLSDKMARDLRVPLLVSQFDLIDADVTEALSRYSFRGISRLTGIR